MGDELCDAEQAVIEARIIPHMCSACGSPVRVVVPDILEERDVIEAAKAWNREYADVFHDPVYARLHMAVEALLVAEGEE